jgi:hypothetical protein
MIRQPSSHNIRLRFETEQTPVTKQNAAASFLVEMAKKNMDQKAPKAEADKDEVPLWEKYTLTIREAADYFHIGEKRLRALVEEHVDADFVIMNGNRAMIIRKLFEKYIDEASVV